MTDNFDIFRKYIAQGGITENSTGSDKVVKIQLLRRGKDNVNLPAKNYSFKTYYIDSIEKYDKSIDEIRECCRMFGLRAYISVNIKSKKDMQMESLKLISSYVYDGNCQKPWGIIDRSYDLARCDDKRWVIDIDAQEDIDLASYVEDISTVIETCKSSHDKNIICGAPSKSGYHLITYPFDVCEFEKRMEILQADKWKYSADIPDIKKNGLSILFEDI